MPIVFDPAAKRIVLDTTSISAEEIWSAWENWVLVGDNSKYGAIMTHTGGDDLGSGRFVSNYFFLQDGWRIRPMEANHTLTVTGNIAVTGGGNPIVSTLGSFNVIAQFTVPVQAQGIATSGSSGPTVSEIASAVRAELMTELARMDATISSRLSSASYTAPDNTSVAAIKAKTDQITVTDGLISSDTKKINNSTVIGDGTEGNKWRH